MDWNKIRKEYETTSITLKALADKHSIKLGTVKSRKSREKWIREETKKDATKKGATKKKKVAQEKGCNQESKHHNIEYSKTFDEVDELNDKQRLFCIHYINSFNATQAAIKAGYSADTAHVQGSRLLNNVKVIEQIKHIKKNMQHGLFVDGMDVINKLIKIAFADITDYVEFDKYTVNIKNSNEVDGSIIQEIKQGREGVSIKLHDKMKALEKLEKYFDILPDHHKRKLEEEKSMLDKKKHELDKRIVELREREESKKDW